MNCRRNLASQGREITLAAIICLAVFVAPTAEAGVPPGVLPGIEPPESVELIVLPAVDVAALQIEDLKREGTGFPRPQRVGTSRPVSINSAGRGAWEILDDGSSLWRLRIASPGAINLSLGLEQFAIPPGAALWVHDPDGGHVQGPYTSEDRNRFGLRSQWTR